MARGGRSRSPSPSRRPAASRAPARRAAPPPPPVRAQPPPQTPMMAPQTGGPGLLGQMAATAGGVAIGSTVGHVVGHALTGGLSGGGSEPHAVTSAPVAEQHGAAPAAGYPGEQTGACAWEIKQFLQCAQQQDDISLCSGFNEAIRQCKEMNRLA